MAKFTALDERFAHQIPEPFPNVLHFHQDWRESLFFIMHEREKPGENAKHSETAQVSGERIFRRVR